MIQRSKRRTKPTHYRPRFETLENRRVLAAAIDLASIGGQVFDDFTGNGFDPGEQVAGATLVLFRDDGDNNFEPNTGDTQVATTTTDGNGQYLFNRLTAGTYFVQQPAQTASGHTLQQDVSPPIAITASDVQGQTATQIDTFVTAQSVSTDGTTASEIAASEAIGGFRDLFVTRTTASGTVLLSVSNPTLFFNAIAGGNGTRSVSWDGSDGDATTIDDTGLNANLTSGNAEGLTLQISSDQAGGNAEIRLYSDDGNAATANQFTSTSISIPVSVGVAEFIPFTAFNQSVLSNVRAIELLISGPADYDGTAQLVGAVAPTPFTANFDNFESADLALTKTASDTTPTTNQNVTFTITVTNNGPDNATGIAVTDQLPGGVTFVSSSATSGSYNSGTGIWTLGNVNNGLSATLSIVGTVTGTGSITNTATISDADQTDANSNNNQSSVTLTPETIDIGLTKLVDNTAPNVGDNVTFTITAFNAGPSNATGVSIRDILPAGLNLFSSSTSSGTFSNGIWTVGNINSGASQTLTIVATVTSTGSRTNTATLISSDQTDINVGNNEASITVAPATADLMLTKTASNPTPNVGENVTFTVTLTNNGPSTATGVTVTDVLPAGMSLQNFSTTQGTYNAANGIWTLNTGVPVSSSPTLTLTARVDTIGAKTNTAQVSNADQSDPNSAPGNNQAGENDQDSVTVTPGSADLALSKLVDNTGPNIGDTITYMLNLTNRGPSTATNVNVLDAIPAGLTFVSSNPTTGTYNSNTGIWNIVSLPSGGNASLSLIAQVDSISSITNTARVESVDQFDPNSTPGNDVLAEDDQDAVTIVPASANLSLTKTVNNANPNVGQQVSFTITVTNSGPNTATGVAVIDQLPAGTTFASVTPSQGNYNSATGVWTVGSIPNGGTASLTLNATANTTGLAVNTAEITAADQRDPNSTPGNNNPNEDDQATAEIAARQIDLFVNKTVSDTSPNVGSQVTFVITVGNDGPDNATGVMVTETLPAGVTLISSSPSQGSFNLNSGVWNVGSIGAGSQATISLIARVDAAGTGTNTAQVTAADQTDVDSAPGNNLESEDDQASISFTTPIADLMVAKTVSNATPNIGDSVSFNVSVANDGPDNATGVTVADALPSGMTFISNNLSAGSYDAGTGVWDIGSLASNATATLEIIGRVDTQGQKTNTARVIASDQVDPDSTPGNNVESEDDQASISLNPAIADLSLTKTASAARPAIGDLVTFTITAANAGPDNATGVNVRDVLPTGLSFNSSNPSIGTYDAALGIWNVGSLASNNVATLELVARVDTLGEKANTAEISTVNQFDNDSTPNNNVPGEDDQATVTVTAASADLSLTKSVDNSSPNVGQAITYTLTVNNSGPDDTAGVMVRDTLPSGVTFQSATPTVGSYDANTRVWTIPTLANGGSAALEIRGVVDTAGDKTNSAEIIASSQLDPDSTPDNNVVGEDDQAAATFSPELVDLALTKTLSNAAPNIGDTITYTLALTNDGPSTASGVNVTDRLPSGLTFVNSTQTAGTYNASTGVWTIDSVPVGATPSLTINATVGSTRSETNTAEITAVNQPDSDSTPGNGVAGEDDIASTTFTTQLADLSLVKTVDNPMPNQTQTVNFTLTLANAGPDTATMVTVSDQLPAGLRFVSATPSVGAYDSTTGLWSVASLPAASSATLQIEAAVTSATPSTNVAEVASVQQVDPDSTPGNALATEDDISDAVVMPQVVDVSVSGSVDNPEPLEGDTIRVVFTASNAGPATATGVTARTLLPLGLTLISSQPLVGSYDSVTGQWNIGSLAAGGSAQLVLNARVDTRGIKQIPIEVTSTNEFDVDSTPANNVPTEDDQAELVIRAPRLLNKRLFMSR